MSVFPYTSRTNDPVALGLLALKTDETIEGDFRRIFAPEVPIHISRVPSSAEVSAANLREMAGHITASAQLLPDAAPFGAVGYGCTSATAQIGADEIARLVQGGVRTPAVSNPLSALVAACDHMGIKEVAFLSPYVADVSDTLRSALAGQGVTSPVFGSFNEASEAAVVRIDAPSIIAAAVALAGQGGQAVFLSCTNLRTLDVIAQIEAETGLPCLSSNQVLAWHMAQLAGIAAQVPGRLGEKRE